MINITEMLERSAGRFPDKTAFADPEKEISFRELRDLSRKIASVFLSGKEGKTAGAGSPVAFYMEKNTDAVCVMFGAVYAGGFYSFIDVRQPAERTIKLLSVLEPVFIITDEENQDALTGICRQGNIDAKPLLITELFHTAENEAAEEDLLQKAADDFCDTDPLYVNFTSGSTGIPKGVAVGHRSVIDFIHEFVKTFDIDEEDVIANQAPFDFDVSVKDIYSGLYTGAKVQLIPRDYFSNPSVLMDYLADHQVTTLIWAVSALCFVSIMNGLEYRVPEKIDKIMFSGEVMPVKQLNRWREHLPDAMYVNLYGPTEITCNCTYYILDREYGKDETLPAGIPFANEKVFLLDENDHLVTQEGQEGEICVGGSCLALGYYKDREKTDRAFTQNPLNDKYYERIYRTGDIGKYDTDGLLIYVSRRDFQIKHMGQRIELGEIETSANSVDGVSRSCCLYDQKRKKIVLFYTGEIEKQELSESLQEKLPQFMIPGKTIRLEEFPLNKNGKIDRKALVY